MAGPSTDPPLIVVITGGIAAGKSAVCDAFARRGVPVIDTDDLARRVVEPGTPGLAALRAAFGEAIRRPDGTLDRAFLKARIFSDHAARRRVEAILHPLIEALARQEVAALTAPYCLIAVPLYAETKTFRWADRVLVVDVPADVQIERLCRRDRIDRPAAERMLAAQADREDRLALADEVIDNRGTPQALEPQVAALHEQYLALAATRRRPNDNRDGKSTQ